jgi:hypothetical protein
MLTNLMLFDLDLIAVMGCLTRTGSFKRCLFCSLVPLCILRYAMTAVQYSDDVGDDEEAVLPLSLGVKAIDNFVEECSKRALAEYCTISRFAAPSVDGRRKYLLPSSANYRFSTGIRTFLPTTLGRFINFYMHLVYFIYSLRCH